MKTHSTIPFFMKCFIWTTLLIFLFSTNNQSSLVFSQSPIPQDKFVYLPLVFYNYPPSVEILSNHMFYDYSGYITGFGEVLNHTSETIYVVTLITDTFDINGDFIKTITIPIGTTLLTPSSSINERTCFYFYLSKGLRTDPVITSLRFKEAQYRTTSSEYFNSANEFTIEDSILYEDYTIEGHVKNNGLKISYSTQVKATYYNLNGKVIGCSGTWVSPYIPFEPGKMEGFSIQQYFFNETGPVTYRLQIFGTFVQ